MPRTPRPWFRLYSDILDNLKVKQLPPALRWDWIEMLALSNLNTPRGQLPPLPQMAFRLRITQSSALTKVERLMAAGLIDATKTGYVMHDWSGDSGWQYESDARATDGRSTTDELRQREGGKWVVAPHYGGGSAAESPQTRGDRSETDTEADPETETEGAQPRSRRRPLTAIEAELPALRDEFSDLNVDEALLAFRDNLKAKGKTFTDYVAAFRNWLRNERKFSNGRPNRDGTGQTPRRGLPPGAPGGHKRQASSELAGVPSL